MVSNVIRATSYLAIHMYIDSNKFPCRRISLVIRPGDAHCSIYNKLYRCKYISPYTAPAVITVSAITLKLIVRVRRECRYVAVIRDIRYVTLRDVERHARRDNTHRVMLRILYFVAATSVYFAVN